MGVIYCTINKINGKRYIGQDSNNNKSYLGSGTNIKKAINKHGIENFYKKILWEGSNEFLNEMEVYWLEYFNCENNTLFYNATNKPKGVPNGLFKGRKNTWGDKIGKSNSKPKPTSFPKGSNHALFGIKHSDKTKQLQSEKIKEFWKNNPDKIKQKSINQSLSTKGKSKNQPFKSILQYDLNGNLIKEWLSVPEAKKWLGKGDIVGCLYNRQKQAGGFIWKYK
jgi:group I intron endonuclease